MYSAYDGDPKPKRKNDEDDLHLAHADDAAGDSPVDLDEAVRAYRAKRKNNEAYDDDDDDLPREKAKRDSPPTFGKDERRRDRNWEDKIEAWAERAEQWGEHFGRRAEQWGENFGRRAEQWGDKVEKKFSQRWGKDFAKGVQNFLSHPYSPNYRVIDEPSTPDERVLASLAHASNLGLFIPFMFLIPLFIYLANRTKSPFVARHALNATVASFMGGIGWLLLTTGAVLIGVVITVALAISIVGILAIPFLWLGIVAVIFASVLIPFGLFASAFFGIIAALRSKTFDYPFIGRLTYIPRRTRTVVD
ncbi:MAG TPA: DUF4870 domain-containing protein [Aggregatilineales bacterium]|nr:DUF4870 domain-containing protein [Anaerolineales bacterium]HRE47453.1 DUF4870 domain-containing protein [Aggregatilineales bacterium]